LIENIITLPVQGGRGTVHPWAVKNREKKPPVSYKKKKNGVRWSGRKLEAKLVLGCT